MKPVLVNVGIHRHDGLFDDNYSHYDTNKSYNVHGEYRRVYCLGLKFKKPQRWLARLIAKIHHGKPL